MFRITSAICLALALGLVGCKAGYHLPPGISTSTNDIPCDPKAVDTTASAEALAVLKLVATFSCEKSADATSSSASTKRVLSGQQLGTVDNVQNYARYNPWFNDNFKDDNTFNTPAVAGVDYAYSSDWSAEQLNNANDLVEYHWHKKRGLVVISWTPSNPWQGGFNTGYSQEVDLTALTQIFPSSAKTRWEDQITRLTNALQDLQHRRVAVIFRPLPLMNSDRYWWGINATGNNKESDFEDLWSDLFKRLNDAGLDNLIWAYSPLDTSENNTKGFDWGFNKGFVDIVAPVVRNNNLDIRDYEAYKTLGKPLGLAELSPATGDGSFDNLKYESRLITNYPAVAFWMSGVNDGDTKRTLVDNKNGKELLTKDTVITAEKISDQNLLSY